MATGFLPLFGCDSELCDWSVGSRIERVNSAAPLKRQLALHAARKVSQDGLPSGTLLFHGVRLFLFESDLHGNAPRTVDQLDTR